jgi:hypothetical protein
MSHRKSQSQKILHWLRKGRKLTAIQALRMFGCFRLSARIKDLRNADWMISARMVTKNGKRYAEYSL